MFESPKHPYTVGLLNSIPTLEEEGKNRLNTIEGLVPSLHQLPKGCAFHDRCPVSMDICKEKQPPLIALPEKREVACFNY